MIKNELDILELLRKELKGSVDIPDDFGNSQGFNDSNKNPMHFTLNNGNSNLISSEVKALSAQFHQDDFDIEGIIKTISGNSVDLQIMKFEMICNPGETYIGFIFQVSNGIARILAGRGIDGANIIVHCFYTESVKDQKTIAAQLRAEMAYQITREAMAYMSSIKHCVNNIPAAFNIASQKIHETTEVGFSDMDIFCLINEWSREEASEARKIKPLMH